MSKFNAETNIWHGPNIPYPYPMDVTFGEVFLKQLNKYPDRVLQIFADDDTELTSNQLRLASIRVAQHLQKIGIQEDDIVGLITHHSHFTTSFIHGCILVGCIVNPLDEQMSEEDILHVFNTTKPKIIVCDSEVIPKLLRALKDVDFNYCVYSYSDTTATNHLDAKNFLKPTGDEENFICPKFAKPSDEKILMILCSSGTTGKVKSICSSHATAINTYCAWPLFASKAKSVGILFSPLFWASGFLFHLGVSFAENETRIWTSRKFSIETFVQLIEKYQITNVLMAPYVLSTLLNSEKFLQSQNQSLKNFMIGGAILSAQARRDFDDRLPNRNLLIGYGMTEAAATFSKPFEYRQSLAVGSIILPNSSLKIIDDNGNALQNGQTGEICSKPSLKFIGYYNNLEATHQLVDEHGFIKTGDIGYFNDEGMLFVVDRKKDIVKYKGMHVNPSEIESVIELIDGVEAVSVVGIPDELCVNLITAAVVKRKGSERLGEKEIIDHVAGKLPEYKQLSGGVYFFEKFPTTLTDKIMKRSIIEEILKLRS